MKQRRATKNSCFTVVLILGAIAIWLIEQKSSSEKFDSPQITSEAPADMPRAQRGSIGEYELYEDCTLVQARNNDGDSFMVRLPNKRQAEFRLYFVDSPESAFKSYRGGDTNHDRIRDQAAELGGISPEQAVKIGKEAKAFTLQRLADRPFTILTRWDSPFRDKRYHAFVKIQDRGTDRWLHEVLIERGLARIKTKPANLPDGTPASRQRDHLRILERQAKRKQTGAWAH